MLGSGRNSLTGLPRASTAAHGKKPPRYGAQNAKSFGPCPVWRKTKQEQVDSKVSNLFESYRAIDREAHAERAKSGYKAAFK